ncbi:HD domain-containing protein [Salinarimonas sp. NSM]|uniref:HD domain-containing protein n=1 Tax=Salinarimonas sp. NSM TaxID=3458003 RepID=UPI0040375635
MTIDDLPPAVAGLLDERGRRLLAFMLELDRLKRVLRRSPLLDLSRVETDAEHSWHVATMALVLSRDAPADVDREAAVRMMLVHDIVEIDAGDTFLYDTKAGATQAEREERAADRLFGLLPDDLHAELRALWDEFEAGETPTARFARGVDRLQPLILNWFSGGGTWNMPGVHRDDVLRRKAPIAGLGGDWWTFGQALIAEGAARGRMRTTPAFAPSTADAKPPAPPPGRRPISRALEEETPDAREIARGFEERYGCAFARLVRFPAGLLDALHAPVAGAAEALEGPTFACTVASALDPAVVDLVERMTRLAGHGTPSRDDHRAYLDAVLSIYDRLRGGMRYLCALEDSVCIAPEREGRILAQRLGCLPPGRGIAPHAKRMTDGGDLLVGHDLAAGAVAGHARAVVIDGAIASGATLMALVEEIRGTVDEVHVFAAHAASSALAALARYSAGAGVRLSVNVGHVSGALGPGRYALHPDGRKVVGDLGDLIAPAVA